MGKKLSEAATVKARARGLLKAARDLLGEKTLPKSLHQQIEDLQTALNRTWADLEQEAGTDAKESDAGIAEADLSFSQTEQLLRMAVQATLPQKTYVYIRDVYDDYLIYQVEASELGGASVGGTFKVAYVVDDKGVVTLGDPEKVLATTVYVPASEAAAIAERKFAKNVGGGVDRDKLPAADFAGKNRSFPIVTPGDVADAASSIGRAGADNYSTDELKRRIIAIAKRKGAAFVAQLPKAWREPQEAAGEVEIGMDFVPLVERAVRKDGTIRVKVIQPGWGSSGYYSQDLLKRDGPKAFTKGLKMFWDHPTPTEEAERPERSLHDLAAELVSDAAWRDDEPAGPGLYADAKAFGGYKEAVEELAPHIGVSIRALGQAKSGEAEGRKGTLIEKIVAAKSVDFVTAPGAGGQVLQLFEAARGGDESPHYKREVRTVDEKEAQELREANSTLTAEVQRLREAALLREAREVAQTTLAGIEMPAMTRARLVDIVAAKPVMKDGKVDVEALKAQIAEAAKAEMQYLAGVTGAGRVQGMGSAGQSGPNLEESQKALEAAFLDLGLSEGAAKVAAAGR